MKNKEIEELLNKMKKCNGMLDYYLAYNEVDLLLSHIEKIKNNRDKAIDYIDITIKLIEQQPTEDDTWILDRLKGFKNILKGDSDDK